LNRRLLYDCYKYILSPPPPTDKYLSHLHKVVAPKKNYFVKNEEKLCFAIPQGKFILEKGGSL
jgi:hypothetical protein